MQMFTWFQATPAEVQEAVEVFRDQLIKKQEEEAITDFINIKKPKLDVDQLTSTADNKMYMGLMTNAYVTGDKEAFIYYSHYYIQHLYWNMVRLPDKSGSSIFEEKDLDARLETMDFHIGSNDNRLAFRAFLELLQQEAQYKGIFKYIHNTDQEDQEAL